MSLDLFAATLTITLERRAGDGKNLLVPDSR